MSIKFTKTLTKLIIF